MRVNTWSQCPNSVGSVRRNFLRAGVLKYRSSTETVVPGACAVGSTSPIHGPSARSAWPCGSSAVRVASEKRDTEAIEASASPRKPMVATASRSSSEPILLVAWRASASGRSLRPRPAPSSSTCTRLVPPASSVTWIDCAPASRLFSSSSFSTEAGRSTTSPAAIWLIRSSGRMRMAAMVVAVAAYVAASTSVPPVMRSSVT